jgi:hypothetical protein
MPCKHLSGVVFDLVAGLALPEHLGARVEMTVSRGRHDRHHGGCR